MRIVLYNLSLKLFLKSFIKNIIKMPKGKKEDKKEDSDKSKKDKDKKKDKKSKKIKEYSREDNIEYIVNEVEQLPYTNRLDILKMIHDSNYKNFITESSDGSRIDAEKLSDELLSEIRKFVQMRIEAVDITATF